MNKPAADRLLESQTDVQLTQLVCYDLCVLVYLHTVTHLN